jgi:hypothetical protein
MVKLAVAADVGVPVIAPLDDNDSPIGNDPLVTPNVYGLTPPDAETVCE